MHSDALSPAKRAFAVFKTMLAPSSPQKPSSDSVTGFLSGQEPSNSHVSGSSPAPTIPAPALPPGYALLKLHDGEGNPFTVVRSDPPTEYEKAWIAGENWGTHGVVWLLRRCLSSNGFLIDLGANLGSVSFPIASTGTPVLAIEMLPSNCLKLHLASLYNGGAHVRVLQAAASSVDGLLEYGGTQAWGAVGQGEDMAMALSLPTLLAVAQAENPDLASRQIVLKLDVEGHEFEVLRGARELLAKELPSILFESIEYADRGPDQQAKQCKHLLEDLGYTLYLQRHHTLIPRRATDLQESLVADFLALPPGQASILEGIDVRALSVEERAEWVDEMTRVDEPTHQRQAVTAIKALRMEDSTFLEATEPSLRRLSGSPYDEVQQALALL